ncbi:hypothetical protein PoB_000017400 [Plakobranchus ocellatus]|uniref:Uncharacterized protein n=1 Tax=Plakobranchus ocellatus TaxID=259542 RepID=A0AAV3XUQ2_9GAST|nr:hypothetical protein PoB_000017400 [Plakobranchus ocellatus]
MDVSNTDEFTSTSRDLPEVQNRVCLIISRHSYFDSKQTTSRRRKQYMGQHVIAGAYVNQKSRGAMSPPNHRQRGISSTNHFILAISYLTRKGPINNKNTRDRLFKDEIPGY